MALSLNEFRERFTEGLLRIHWRQWSALGVASQVAPEEHRVIDLEPLIASTQAIGAHDRRLLSCAVEWMERNDAWINHARLNRMQRLFPARLRQAGGSVSPEANEETKDQLAVSEVEPSAPAETVRDRRPQYRARGDKIADFVLRYPSHLQFRLRGLMGITASAEVMLYLMSFGGGNSNAIAEEMGHDQKNVYRILEQWVESGIVKKSGKRKDGVASRFAYALTDKQHWGKIFEYYSEREHGVPALRNWRRTFLALDRLAATLGDPRFMEDEYLMSSHFRDIYPLFDAIGTECGIDVPPPERFQGATYWQPFAVAALKIGDRLLVIER